MHDDAKAAAAGAMRTNREVKAMQTLMGLVTGMVADQHLHDLEIQFLSTWLASNQEITSLWPGSAVASRLAAILADGVVTEDERTDLLATLSDLVATDFANTGSTDAEHTRLPVDDTVPLTFAGRKIVHTGKFAYGTRPRCERLSTMLGAEPRENPSREVDVVVVGTFVSPDWVTTSYGRKIMTAMQLRAEGAKIAIITERRWLEQAKAAGHVD